MINRVLRMILLGAPGAGKGTQAKKMSSLYGIPQISTGDILRGEIDRDTDIGREAQTYMTKGLLVPDSLVVAIVQNRLKLADCKEGYILDGFPRTLEQAEAIDKSDIDVDLMLLLDAPDDVILKRLSGRRVCMNCQRMYHVIFKKPRKDGICDECGAQLITRKDDAPATIQKRIQVYRDQTAPLIAYYQNHPSVKYVHVNGGESDDDTPVVVFDRIRDVLEAGESR